MVNLWSIMVNNWNNNISGWWFGTWMDYDFPIILGISSSQLTISIIFRRGRCTTNQQWWSYPPGIELSYGKWTWPMMTIYLLKPEVLLCTAGCVCQKHSFARLGRWSVTGFNRGLVAYHGLASGQTSTAIAVLSLFLSVCSMGKSSINITTAIVNLRF